MDKMYNEPLPWLQIESSLLPKLDVSPPTFGKTKPTQQ